MNAVEFLERELAEAVRYGKACEARWARTQPCPGSATYMRLINVGARIAEIRRLLRRARRSRV